MKKPLHKPRPFNICLILLMFLTASVFAQAPQKMSYQAVIRDAGNELVVNAEVGMQISILHLHPTGTAVYVETHTASTNDNGLISLEIGAGTVVSGSMEEIDWADGPYFIKTETDPGGGTNYSITATTQLLSVPYALYAETGGTPGSPGEDGVGIDHIEDNEDGTYTFVLTDGSTYTTSDLTGPVGGDGVGIESVEDNQDGTFTLYFTDGSSFTTSDFTGPAGETGVGIESVEDNQDGTFTLHFTDGSFFTTSDFTGPEGSQGPEGPEGPEGPVGNIPDGYTPGDILIWNGEEWVSTNPVIPVVTTMAVSDITETSATIGGTVISQGSVPVTARGMVWDTNENPTLHNNLGSSNEGSGAGSFTTSLTDLDPSTQYFVKAYATNSEGTAYGREVTFSTDAEEVFPPTVTTAEVTEIAQTTALSGGDVTDEGGSTVSARGIVWHTSSNPTLENNLGQTSDGSGLGSFVSELTNLEPNTGYYVRAYAVNSQGVSYGNQRVFSTQQDGDLPTVITAEATDITQTSVSVSGEVTDDGGSTVLARGVCWSTEESPTLSDNFNEEGEGMGAFTSQLDGLSAGTTYYVRAFASNHHGLAYGNQVSFSTDAGSPNVTITRVGVGQPGLRVVDAIVTSDGGAEVTARGFIWNTQENPTLEQNEGYNTLGSGLGEYSGELSGLTPNTRYYVRAYASNSEGTGYSEQRVFHFWDYHGILTDIEGNTYNTIMIGDQEWMAENLRVTRYRNNIPIPTGLSDTEWENTTDGAYAIYDHTHWAVGGINSPEEMVDYYGKLYNWFAVDDLRGICPSGWRVPTDDDWEELVDFVVAQGYPNETNNRNGAGNALKSCRQVDSPLGGDCDTSEHPRWSSHSTHHGFDEFGFSALPGGRRVSDGGFFNFSFGSYWWSSTETSSSFAWYRLMRHEGGYVGRYDFSKTSGFSLRCVRDLD